MTCDQRRPVSTFSEDTKGGLGHLGGVIRRRAALVVASTVLALILGVVGALSATSHYTATSQLLINQPALTAPADGQSAVQKLSELMTTITQLATSDAVLQGVVHDAGSNRSVSDLRGHISATVMPQSLVLNVAVSFPTERETTSVAGVLLRQIASGLGTLSVPSAAPNTQYTATVLQAPTVRLASSGKARTVAIALFLGLGFGLVVAFVLERA